MQKEQEKKSLAAFDSTAIHLILPVRAGFWKNFGTVSSVIRFQVTTIFTCTNQLVLLLCKQKHLFWMRLIASNHLTALIHRKYNKHHYCEITNSYKIFAILSTPKHITINNHDYYITQNNHNYDLCHNQSTRQEVKDAESHICAYARKWLHIWQHPQLNLLSAVQLKCHQQFDETAQRKGSINRHMRFSFFPVLLSVLMW